MKLLLLLTLCISNMALAKTNESEKTRPANIPVSALSADEIIKLFDETSTPEEFLGTWKLTMYLKINRQDPSSYTGFLNDDGVRNATDQSQYTLTFGSIATNTFLPQGENSEYYAREDNLLLHKNSAQARPQFVGGSFDFIRKQLFMSLVLAKRGHSCGYDIPCWSGNKLFGLETLNYTIGSIYKYKNGYTMFGGRTKYKTDKIVSYKLETETSTSVKYSCHLLQAEVKNKMVCVVDGEFMLGFVRNPAENPNP